MIITYMNKITVHNIISLLESRGIDFEYKGRLDLSLDGLSSLSESYPNKISFYRGEDIEFLKANQLNNRLTIVRKSFTYSRLDGHNLLYVENPDVVFCIIGTLFSKSYDPYIHPTAFIHPNAQLDSTCYIGAFTYIDENVTIGANTVVEEGVVLKHCNIGSKCHIYPGVKIGSSGLGSHKDEKGTWHIFPHIGKVIVNSNVIIQDNTVIARGTLNDTLISEGVNIGPNCWIAHGVVIEKNVLISQAVIIAGSTKICENAIIWGNSSIRDNIIIGADSVIGLGATVIKDVPNGQTWVGNPARNINKI